MNAISAIPMRAMQTAEPKRAEARRHFRTIWISDIHLGTRGCNADMLIDFLDSVDSDTL
ncbi:MAG: UDP-2,3-diacylglucosamine diphosphatase, partial [Sphingobium sp.]